MEPAVYLTKENSKETNKATLSKIQSFLKENNVSNGKISDRFLFIAEREKTFEKCKENSCSTTLPIEKMDNALRKKLAEDPKLDIAIKIECSVGVGDQFQPIEGDDRPEIGGEKNLTISHTEGDCTPC